MIGHRPRWKMTFKIAELWQKGPARDDELEAEDFANAMVIELKALHARAKRHLDAYDLERLEELTEDLSCQIDSEFGFDDFDNWWSDFYDWADASDVWVETVR